MSLDETTTGDAAVVRTMREDDLDDVVRIDAQESGRSRRDYFELMLRRSVKDSRLQASLVATIDGRTVGFLIASVFYGDFGVVEPAASIDAIGVQREYRGRRVASELLNQLRLNLSGLRVRTIRTEVAWDDFDLLGFFKREGFAPAQRLCLELEVDPTRPT